MWQKVLWRTQGVPDNYVDASFLGEMKKNVTVRLYTWRWLVLRALRVAHHAAAILVFVSFFIFLHRAWIAPSTLIVLANCVTLVAYVVWLVLYITARRGGGAHVGRQVAVSGIIFMMTLLGLTPILKTLTEDTSSDTIWALSAACFIANFVFHDYAGMGAGERCAARSGPEARARPRNQFLDAFSAKRTPPGMLALNAAIFASVMLASRLPTKAHVYGLMSLAVDWFALLPLFERALAPDGPESAAGVAISLCMVCTAFVMLLSFSVPAAVAWLLAAAAITLVLPAVYVRLQRYKNEIHGPWDEASVVLRRRP